MDSRFFNLLLNSESSGDVIKMMFNFWTIILANSRSCQSPRNAHSSNMKLPTESIKISPITQGSEVNALQVKAGRLQAIP